MAVVPRSRERGLTLIGVLILILIMSIMLSAAMPVWTTIVKREKEEDLIFRGEQYVAAIEGFQLVAGRPPTKLEELTEFKTIQQEHFIRKLYKDPMSKDGEWDLIYPNTPGGGATGATGPSGASGPAGLDRNRGGRAGGLGFGVSPNMGAPGVDYGGGQDYPGQPEGDGEQSGAGSQTGPSLSRVDYTMPGRASRQQLQGGFIIGVRSKSTEKSMKIYQGKEAYNEWEFRARLFRRAPERLQERRRDMYPKQNEPPPRKGDKVPPNLRPKDRWGQMTGKFKS